MRTITAGVCVKTVLGWAMWLAARPKAVWRGSPTGEGAPGVEAGATVIGLLF
jgi:hypothetical protein